jgi:hypothetical protein
MYTAAPLLRLDYIQQRMSPFTKNSLEFGQSPENFFFVSDAFKIKGIIRAPDYHQGKRKLRRRIREEIFFFLFLFVSLAGIGASVGKTFVHCVFCS